MTTTYTTESLMKLTPKGVGEVCKTNKIKSYTSQTLEQILEKLNISKDDTETETEKKPRKNKCPNKLARNHEGEQMIGVNGNMWSSVLNAKGKWSWKENKGTADIEVMADFSKESADNTENDASDNETKDESKEEPKDEVKEEIKPKKAKSERKAPSEKAKDHPDEEMEGSDGKMYKSKEDKNGTYRWGLAKN
jgi:hypothetical protein